MKKLFLYVGIFSFVFWSFFLMFKNLYSEKEREKYSKISQEYLKSDVEDITVDEMTNEDSFKETLNQTQNPEEYNHKDSYILGFQDDFVVIYKNNTDEVFEYTDVQAELLKALQKDEYEAILNTIAFERLEDVYSFLEAISS